MNTLFYRNLVFCQKPIDFFHSISAPSYPCSLGDVAHLLTLQSVRIRQSKQAETIRVSKHPRRLGLTNNNYLNYSSLRQNFLTIQKNFNIKFSYFLSLYNFRIFVKIIRSATMCCIIVYAATISSYSSWPSPWSPSASPPSRTSSSPSQ